MIFVLKITIENIEFGSEPEIIIKCREVDELLIQHIHSFKSKPKKLIGICDSEMVLIEPKDVYYFESIDNKSFIYCSDKVIETKLRLYEIENDYEYFGFFRVSKSVILSLEKINTLKPAFNGRFEALLHNGEKVIISRQFVPVLRKKLGL